MSTRVAGLLLAAGGGRRFGQTKALVRFRGELLVIRGVRLLEAGGCAPVVVVVGANAEDVRPALSHQAVRIIDNPDWTHGMGSSLRAGLAALRGEADAVVVALVDQPLIGSQAVRRLIDARRRGAVAAVATYGGRPRNPVLLGSEVWDAAAASASGDRGARAFLAAHAGIVQRIRCDDTGSPQDIDTRDDLRAAAGCSQSTDAGAKNRSELKEEPWS